MHACVLSSFCGVQLFVILWTIARWVPLSLGFSRQGYWSGLPCPPPRDLPDPGIKPVLVDKVMSLLFNMLSRLVIAFLPRSKHLLISWLQSPSAVILEPTKRKSVTVSISICHEVMGPDAMIFIF